MTQDSNGCSKCFDSIARLAGENRAQQKKALVVKITIRSDFHEHVVITVLTSTVLPSFCVGKWMLCFGRRGLALYRILCGWKSSVERRAQLNRSLTCTLRVVCCHEAESTEAQKHRRWSGFTLVLGEI